MVNILMSVPRTKLGQFQEIFHRTNCRYTKNPYWSGDVMYVHFSTDNYNEFSEAWSRVTTPIRELDGRPNRFLKIWRRFKANIRGMFRGNA